MGFGWLWRRLKSPLTSLQQTPPSLRYKRYHKVHEAGVSTFAGACICINLIMGSGFLALPHAFYEAGLVLSVCVLLVVVLTMRVTSLLEVEIMCRAEAVTKDEMAPLGTPTPGKTPAAPMWDSAGGGGGAAAVADLRRKALVASTRIRNSPARGHSVAGDITDSPGGRKSVTAAARTAAAAAMRSVDGGGRKKGYSLLAAAENGAAGGEAAGNGGSKGVNGAKIGDTEDTSLSPSKHLRVGGGGSPGIVLDESLILDGTASPGKPGKRSKPAMGLSEHAYQVTELCEMFGGERAKVGYDFTIALYMFCTLWGYTAVFGTALAAHLTPMGLGPAAGYLLYVVIFAFIVVPLSIMDVKEQVAFQVFMTILRFLVVVAMLGTVVSALLWPDTAPFGAPQASGEDAAPLVRWIGIFEVLPAIMFASMLNSSVPVVVQALDDKSAIGRVISVAMSFTFFTYLSLGVLIAYYFGSGTDRSCNVNWAGVGAEDSSSPAIGALLAVISLFVLLFPALDVLSIYPLNVMVLSNNMMAAVYHDRIDKAEHDKVIVATFRVACALPPIFCAMVFPNLSKVVGYAGSLALIISMVVPPYLAMRSRSICQERFGFSDTPFDGIFSVAPAQKAIILIGLLLLTAIAVQDVAAFFVAVPE